MLQAERWGAELLIEDVESVDLSQRPFVIKGFETTVGGGAQGGSGGRVVCSALLGHAGPAVQPWQLLACPAG